MYFIGFEYMLKLENAKVDILCKWMIRIELNLETRVEKHVIVS